MIFSFYKNIDILLFNDNFIQKKSWEIIILATNGVSDGVTCWKIVACLFSGIYCFSSGFIIVADDVKDIALKVFWS